MMSDELRQRLLEAFLQQGFTLADGRLVPPDPSCKENIRQLYVYLRAERLQKARSWLLSVEEKMLSYFADGSEVDVPRIRPRLEFVDTQLKADLFRYASLLWSVPVSAGYGRRMRFLVFDEHNGKLMGLFALGDPVYNLRVRDRWIGWGVPEKNERLYHVMDAYVIGAVPPYSDLLGGKLMALLTTSNEVREVFRRRYAQRASVLRKVVRDPHLVLLTTMSALGRSSIYNRISVGREKVFISVGFTEGWGHFQFPDSIFEQIKAYLREMGDPVVRQCRYDDGPNWRFRVIRKCLADLGLSPDLLRHGIGREVFVVPLAANAREFLRGEDPVPVYYERPADWLFDDFRSRWLLPRAAKDPRYQTFSRDSVRLSRCLDCDPAPLRPRDPAADGKLTLLGEKVHPQPG
ncbi:Druantia anti-phage system protein DruA [Thermogutta sp.]|uniref:Druantia anti-phage system protein DruA n=1 Tax=Thermogutta sp. TaxID=1962930 RepID=UPI0032202D3E